MKKAKCINKQVLTELPLYMPGKCLITDAYGKGLIMIIFDSVPYIGFNPPENYVSIDGAIVWVSQEGSSPIPIESQSLKQSVLDNFITINTVTQDSGGVLLNPRIEVTTNENTYYANIMLQFNKDMVIDNVPVYEIFGMTQEQASSFFDTTECDGYVAFEYGKTEPTVCIITNGTPTYSYEELQEVPVK